MTKAPNNIQWIGVDWGTSNLRTWGIGSDQEIVFSKSSEQGMGNLQPDQFEAALLSLIEPHLTQNWKTTIICCGMVGAKTGWREAPYIVAPCSPQTVNEAILAPSKDMRIKVYLLPGISQIDPPDVMRGEETQLAGILQNNPEFSGTVCLPGTHSKWIKIDHGEIQSFRTFMTGEIFSLIMTQSLLRQPKSNQGWDDDAFVHGLHTSIKNPNMLSADLFSLRAKMILEELTAAKARATISGLLIGLELSAALQSRSEEKLVLVGDGNLGDVYGMALNELSVDFILKGSQKLSLAGLRQAYAQLLKGQKSQRLQ